MKTVTALLDFDEAIRIFRMEVQEALIIGEIRDWDGRELLRREIKITQAALRLAGQCIGLLLYLLAINRDASAQASQRTWHLRHIGSQGQGKRPVKIQTIGRVQVTLRIQYVVKRNSSVERKPGQRGAACGQGFYPFLKWLGIQERITHLVWINAAQQSILHTSFEAAQESLRLSGIDISTRRQRRLTYSFGQIGLNIRQSHLEQLMQGKLISRQMLAGQRVVISVDGGRTRIRKIKEDSFKKQTNRYGYEGEWKEPKLLTIYVVDKEGKKIRNSLPTNDGTFGDVEAFMLLLEMHLVRLGVHRAKQVLLVADGAKWIWERIPFLLQRLGCAKEHTLCLLDFYHASQRLFDFANWAFNDKKDVNAWAFPAKSALKRGQIATLLSQMQALIAKTSYPKQKEGMSKAYQYFFNRSNELDYPRAIELKLPLGSGSIESLIRQVVNLRLKSSNKSWKADNAEIVLHARCQWAAGNWTNFRDSVLMADLSSLADLSYC